MNKIVRYNNVILRSVDDESRVIEGCAIVFDSWSRDLGGFIEKINSSALSEEFLAEQDVILNVDHDNSRMLARYNKGVGTLSLELREDGLWFRFECPTTAFGDEILYHVRHNNLYECSFAALISRSDITRTRGEEGLFLQEINRIGQLLDVSIVCRAAYPATSVSARDAEEAAKEFEEIKSDVEAQEEAKRAEEEAAEEARKAEIISSLDSLKENFLAGVKNIDELKLS